MVDHPHLREKNTGADLCPACRQDSALDILQSQQNKAAGGWMDTILNLIPGRKQQSANEPSEEAIKRTHEFLRWLHFCTIWAVGELQRGVTAAARGVVESECT